MKNQVVWLRAGLWILLGATLVPAIAHADLLPTPTMLTFNGTRGEVVSRTLVLQSTEAVRMLQAIALDAQSEDGGTVLPAGAIALGDLPAQLPENALVPLPIQIDLQNAPSGEFTGSLLLHYADGQEAVPVLIRVKDPWVLPLLTLVGGIGLGMAVSAYSQQGKPTDELIVSLEALRRQIAPMKKAARSFGDRTELHLAIAQSALAANQLGEAEQSLNDARTTWNHWLRYQPSWQLQFDYYDDTLLDRLNKYVQAMPDFLAIRTLSRNLNTIYQTAPDDPDPKAFQQKLDDLAQQLNTYIRTQYQLSELSDLMRAMEGEALLHWENEIATMQQELYSLPPDNLSAYQSLQAKMEEAATEMKSQGARSLVVVEKSLGGEMALLLVPGAPGVRGQSTAVSDWSIESKPGVREETPSQGMGRAIAQLWRTARGRLRLFYAASYLISFILLAGGGFNELYLSKPTFGDRGWGDYFALLALGFGVEATRNVVTRATEGNGNT